MGLLDSVRVVRQNPGVVSRTEVPSALKSALAEKGFVGKWVHGGASYLTEYTSRGWQVLLWSDIEDEATKKRVRPEIENPERHFGEIRRGDCVLVYTTPDNIQYWNGVNAERNRHQMGDSPSLMMDATQNALAEAGVPSHFIRANEELARRQPTVDKFVSGGPTLDPNLAAELAGQTEEYPT